MHDTVVDIVVDPVQQGALNDHQAVQLLVEIVELVNGLDYFEDLLVALLVHF